MASLSPPYKLWMAIAFLWVLQGIAVSSPGPGVTLLLQPWYFLKCSRWLCVPKTDLAPFFFRQGSCADCSFVKAPVLPAKTLVHPCTFILGKALPFKLWPVQVVIQGLCQNRAKRAAVTAEKFRAKSERAPFQQFSPLACLEDLVWLKCLIDKKFIRPLYKQAVGSMLQWHLPLWMLVFIGS